MEKAWKGLREGQEPLGKGGEEEEPKEEEEEEEGVGDKEEGEDEEEGAGDEGLEPSEWPQGGVE